MLSDFVFGLFIVYSVTTICESTEESGLPSQSQQNTYSETSQLTNSGFVPIAKPLIAKLPERYDNTQTSAGQSQTQVDPGLVLTRMGYTTNGDYEVPNYGFTNDNNNNKYSQSALYSDHNSANLLRNLKQDSLSSLSNQDAQDSSVQNVYDVPSVSNRNIKFGDRYNKYLQSSQSNGANDDYSTDSQTSSEVASRQNFYKQLNSDTEVSKFLKSASEASGELAVADSTEETADQDQEYGADRNPQLQDYQLNQLSNAQKPSSYQMLNEDQQMISPEMAQQLFKQYAQTQDLTSNSLNDNSLNQNTGSTSESDMQALINQLTMASQPSINNNWPQKSQQDMLTELVNNKNLQQELSANNMQQLANYGQQMTGSQIQSQMNNNQALHMNGMQNFSPAPEGGQLPAPPGYKHVGYITIPAGTANVPNIVNTASAGLPIIRPMPIMSAPPVMPGSNSNRLPLGMTQKHLQSFQDQSKKQQEKQTSESKPRRTFLSRLNPLNMLRRLRQRRERRQTGDTSVHSSGVNEITRMSNSGIYGMTSPMRSSNSGAYGSVSGLGGMSGLNGMYASMSGPQPVYTGVPGISNINGYGPAMTPYAGGYSYGGYPSTGFGYMPQMFAQSGSGASDATQPAASNVMATSATDGTQAMQMPMMMPYNPMGGFSQMAPMAMQSMPMGSMGSMGSMGMGSMPYAMVPQQQQQQTSQQDDSQESNPNQLPGGLNLSDLLKDEEDEEPSRFRRFLSYLNPVNLFRRLRDRNATENEDRKRFGRYRRHITEDFADKSFLHFPETSGESSPRGSRILFLKRSGRKSRMRFPRNDDSDSNTFNETNDNINNEDIKDDKLYSADSGLHPLSDHTSDESIGRSRNRHNYRRSRRPNQRTHFSSEGREGRHLGLMGSGNFEVIRGGTFRPEETTSSTHSTSEDSSLYDSESSGNVFSAIEEDIFDSGSPEVLGFQGFNGFGSMYNTLSASNKMLKLATIDKRRDSIGNIENPALTTTELRATS